LNGGNGEDFKTGKDEVTSNPEKDDFEVPEEERKEDKGF
jgi:hypothetical protein